jgi:hypothetical protein
MTDREKVLSSCPGSYSRPVSLKYLKGWDIMYPEVEGVLIHLAFGATEEAAWSKAANSTMVKCPR